MPPDRQPYGYPPPRNRIRRSRRVMPKLALRFAAVLALTALMFAGAFTLMNGPVLAQDSQTPAQDDPQDPPQDPQDDGTEESDDGTEESDDGTEESDDGTEESDDGTEEADDGTEEAEEQLETVFLWDEEFVVETDCPDRASSVRCTYETRYFAFDTPYEYYEFLTERTDWLHSRIDPLAPEADYLYWQNYRHSLEEWPEDTLQTGDAPTSANISKVDVLVPLACPDSIASCDFIVRRFDFEKGINQAIYFMEDRDDWIWDRMIRNNNVSYHFWRNYRSSPPPVPPYLANSEWTVETACDDGIGVDDACDTETFYFHFHTEVQYFSFLTQRADWQQSRFNTSDDDDSTHPNAQDPWLYWQSFDYRENADDDPAMDDQVANVMSLDDVALLMDVGCNADLSDCTAEPYYFDFTNNLAAVDFALERIAWLGARFSADSTADEDWWRIADYTIGAGEPNVIQNLRLYVEQGCSGSGANMRCNTDLFYFHFATESDYLHFLKELGDARMAQYDPNSSIAEDESVRHQFWTEFDAQGSHPRPLNEAAEDPVRGDFDISAVQLVVPANCDDNLKGCEGQLREFTFANNQAAINLLQERIDWFTGVLNDDDTVDPNYWSDERSWEQRPAELQGLRINNIPWCYDAAGQQVCSEITRYFWHVDWRDRAAFQRAHQAYQDGADTATWDFWMDYDWGYTADAIVNQNLLQNQRIQVPVACTGPFSCLHGVKFMNFTDWQQKGAFQALHESLKNDGNQSTFYWAAYDWSDTPH